MLFSYIVTVFRLNHFPIFVSAILMKLKLDDFGDLLSPLAVTHQFSHCHKYLPVLWDAHKSDFLKCYSAGIVLQ